MIITTLPSKYRLRFAWASVVHKKSCALEPCPPRCHHLQLQQHYPLPCMHRGLRIRKCILNDENLGAIISCPKPVAEVIRNSWSATTEDSSPSYIIKSLRYARVNEGWPIISPQETPSMVKAPISHLHM